MEYCGHGVMECCGLSWGCTECRPCLFLFQLGEVQKSLLGLGFARVSKTKG